MTYVKQIPVMLEVQCTYLHKIVKRVYCLIGVYAEVKQGKSNSSQ
jgi:hypothetical protein